MPLFRPTLIVVRVKRRRPRQSHDLHPEFTSLDNDHPTNGFLLPYISFNSQPPSDSHVYPRTSL